MPIDPRFWEKRRVCITGGSGFLGWHLVKQLRELGADLRILALKPRESHPLLALDDIDFHWGDIRDPAIVRKAIQGCDVVFHTAGSVASWGPALKTMRDIHLSGTRNVLDSLDPGARLVHTSSVVAVGASRSPKTILNEDAEFNLRNLRVEYVHAKRLAEEMVLADGKPAVVVNPGYLVGPEDFERSIMGRLCDRFWRGRVVVALPGGLNYVDVRDVATGHLLAAEKGQPGRRYILGGENLDYPAFYRQMAATANYRPRWLPKIPWTMLYAISRLAEIRSRIKNKEAYPSLEGARLSRYCWFYASQRAIAELGYAPRPLAETLADSFRWHSQFQTYRPKGLNGWMVGAGR
jgi:dihydroflavonol-4-reductase